MTQEPEMLSLGMSNKRRSAPVLWRWKVSLMTLLNIYLTFVLIKSLKAVNDLPDAHSECQIVRGEE